MAEICERSEPHKISPTLGGFPLKVFVEISKQQRKKVLNRLKFRNSSWISKKGEDSGKTTGSKIGKTGKYRESQLTKTHESCLGNQW